jgi:hypothetical protein
MDRIWAGVTNDQQGLGATAEGVVVHDKCDVVTPENELALDKLSAPPSGQAIALTRSDLALQPFEPTRSCAISQAAFGLFTVSMQSRALARSRFAI